MASLRPEQITIAITVYDRQQYVGEAIRSALEQQTLEKPKVIVVEDCGPNPGLRESILKEFGNRIEYFRNSKRRGLFDNWNACIEACGTEWLCILHDDDFLEPTFVESMIELSAAAPGRGLYYGLCDVVDDQGRPVEKRPRAESFSWHETPLKDWVTYDPVCFPAQLFNLAAARACGGFRKSSRYTADWEMWFKLTINYGSAATNRVIANYRKHYSIGRGTTEVDLAGRTYAYTNMQRKRHFALAHRLDSGLRFNRRQLLRDSPMSLRYILSNGYKFSPRMLRYNAALLTLSSDPHAPYRFFRVFTKVFSWRILRVASWLFQFFKFGSTPSVAKASAPPAHEQDSH